MTEITPPNFADLGLSEGLLGAIARCGYDAPTPIQQKAVIPMLAGHDVLGAAKTGSGKTGAFVWPMLQFLAKTARPGKKPRALILAPTRELAAQIQLSILRYRGDSDLRPVLIIGGESPEVQQIELKMGCDILVATPGRLIDAVLARAVELDEVSFIVLDEADRMLEMGFYNDTRKLLRACKPERQSALFSATLHQEIEVLAEHVLTDPLRVEADPPGTLVETIAESEIRVKPSAKAALIQHLLGETEGRTIVFTSQRVRVVQLAGFLGEGVHSLHGSMSQHERKAALKAFRHAKRGVMVATDIASRGLDIDDIDVVIHADIPKDPLDYIHRAGRSARMGREGSSIMLVSDEEVPRLEAISKLVGHSPIRREVANFDFEAQYEPLPSVELASKDRPKDGKSGPEKGERARRRQKAKKRNQAQGAFKVKRSSKVRSSRKRER